MADHPTVNELLVALVDPASAEAEVGWGAALASALQVPVRLVHVFDPALTRDPYERAEAMANDLLAIVASDVRWEDTPIARSVVPGLLEEELPRLAAERPGTILLVARGGGWGAVLRRLATPFILLPSNVIAPRQVSTVVIGVDGSDLAIRVAELADEFARRLEFRIVQVEAIEPGTTQGPAFLEATSAVGVDRVQVRGRAGQVISSVARARDAALIVVGSHGKGQMTRLLLGSTSEWLAAHADRPLLVVPEKRAYITG